MTTITTKKQLEEKVNNEGIAIPFGVTKESIKIPVEEAIKQAELIFNKKGGMPIYGRNSPTFADFGLAAFAEVVGYTPAVVWAQGNKKIYPITIDQIKESINSFDGDFFSSTFSSNDLSYYIK